MSKIARALINIDVPDLAAAIDFYAAAVGTQFRRFLDDDVAELAYGSSLVYLLLKSAASKATPNGDVRGFDRHWTPVHVDFVVTDIDAAVERAAAAGATRESECIEWRGSKVVTFSDPFGNGFCVIAFDGDGYQ
jgi:predicted enzyme related to lactoylglutathione lyase